MTENITADLRPLRPDDLERVIEIDKQVGGRARRVFFEKRLEAALAHTKRFIPVAVDVDGALRGFAIARLQRGEFGEQAESAVLDVIGVDESHRHAGLGHDLIEGIAGYLGKRGIAELRTQVDWHDRAIVGFFSGADFQLSPHQVLERAVGPLDSEADDDDQDFAEPQRDAGMNDYSDPGGDDFRALSRDRLPVRSMTLADIDDVVRIDRKLTGRDRREYYEAKLDEALNESGVRVSLVAEMDDRPVGFIMARVDFGEFGRAEPVAVMDTIGVDPDRAAGGVGSAILSQLMANLDALRVEQVRTRVNWDQFGILGFLRHYGFRPAQQLVLRHAF